MTWIPSEPNPPVSMDLVFSAARFRNSDPSAEEAKFASASLWIGAR
ncbi:hypothetical protein [Arthrobacter sp. SO3]|nr:hypothetical protein [Arthrobacter sp. SO3]